MPKPAIISETWADKRIRQGKGVVVAFTAVCALSGYAYIVAKLVASDFGPALVGLIATLAACGVGAVAWGSLRLARLAVSTTNDCERLRYRLDMLEAVVELRDAEAGLGAEVPGVGGPIPSTHAEEQLPPIVAERDLTFQEPAGAAQETAADDDSHAVADIVGANMEEEERQFQRAVNAEDLHTCRSVWPRLRQALDAKRAAALEEQLAHLHEVKSRALRDEFGSLVRNRDFQAAMQKGEEIAELFPESRMTADYRNLRPHLERRRRQVPASGSPSQ